MFYPWVSAVSLVLKRLAKWKVLIYSQIFLSEDGDMFQIRLGCLGLPWGNNTPGIGSNPGVSSKTGELALPTPQIVLNKFSKSATRHISGIPTSLCPPPLPPLRERTIKPGHI
jgi:hypothetical protein